MSAFPHTNSNAPNADYLSPRAFSSHIPSLGEYRGHPGPRLCLIMHPLSPNPIFQHPGAVAAVPLAFAPAVATTLMVVASPAAALLLVAAVVAAAAKSALVV